jgi:uncharacterized protein (TIGR01777 family)
MKIFITGGSGFVGTNLSVDLLEKGHSIIAVGTSSTHRVIRHDNFHYISADTTITGDWQDAVKDADAVINLAGKNIFKRWTDTYKDQIYTSRILTTRNLVQAMAGRKDSILCSTSAVGYYGDRADDVLKEDTQPGDDFAAKVCRDWEKEAFQAEEKGVRVAITRFGVVLGRNGGALEKMLPAFKSFVGGPLGSGRQWFPWIHMDDLIAAMVFILENPDINGPINFCSPNPVRNRDFVSALGQVLNRPSALKAPSFMIRLIMGEMGQSLMSSQRAIPDKLLKHGFKFQYPDINNALYNLIVS